MALSTGRRVCKRRNWSFAVVGVTRVVEQNGLRIGFSRVIAFTMGLARRRSQTRSGSIFKRKLRVTEAEWNGRKRGPSRLFFPNEGKRGCEVNSSRTRWCYQEGCFSAQEGSKGARFLSTGSLRRQVPTAYPSGLPPATSRPKRLPCRA